MTIASATNKSGPYFYNGSATSFAYQFKISNAAHIRVVETVIATGVETDLALNTDYTVTGVGADAGGNVVISPPRATGKSVTLVRNVPFTQLTVLENQGAYFAKVVEGALDAGVARDQQLAEQISRAVVVPVSADPTDLETLIGGVIGLLDNVDAVVTAAANIAAITAAPTLAAQTAADRVQTGLDKVATAGDRVQTGLDRVATAADRVATAADRLQTGLDRAAAEAAAGSVDPAQIKWLGKAIGEMYAVDDSMAGAEVPPTNSSSFRYIKLTAADAYNNGVVISESVSGSAPAVQATGIINLTGSAITGRTVRLINTERRVRRAGAAGTVEADQFLNHPHTASFAGNAVGDHTHGYTAAGYNGNDGGGGATTARASAATGSTTGAGGAHTPSGSVTVATSTAGGTETRGKNLGVTYYMRIK